MAVMSSDGKASIDAIASENGRIKENETVCPSWQSRKICCLTSSKSICTSGFQPRNQATPPKKNLPLKYGKKSWPCASWGRSSDIACYAKLWQQLRPMMINWSDSPITNFLITLSYCAQIKDSKMRTNHIIFAMPIATSINVTCSVSNSLRISSFQSLGHVHLVIIENVLLCLCSVSRYLKTEYLCAFPAFIINFFVTGARRSCTWRAWRTRTWRRRLRTWPTRQLSRWHPSQSLLTSKPLLAVGGGPVREEAQPVRRRQDLQRCQEENLRLDAPGGITSDLTLSFWFNIEVKILLK